MNVAYKLIKLADKIMSICIYFILVVALLFCLYALFDTLKVYIKASNNNIAALKPDKNNPIESFKALKAINEDVCAWITIDNTKIDYPVVRGKDNIEYVNKDVYKTYSLAGCLFLDYRNSMDFSDLYSVIYGHHMNGGAMFGNIPKYSKEEFFNKNNTGSLYTEKGVYSIEVIAYLSTDAYDEYIYDINPEDKDMQQKFISYIKSSSARYSGAEITEKDNLLCLSTCTTATTNGRDVLILKITQNE